MIQIDQDMITISVRALIDSDITYNFISQNFVKKHELLSDVAMSKSLSIIDDISLRLYQSHFLLVRAVNCDKKMTQIKHDVYEADMTDIDLILSLT